MRYLDINLNYFLNRLMTNRIYISVCTQKNSVAIAYFDVLEISREIKFCDSLDDPNLLFLQSLKNSLHALTADSEEEISGCLVIFPSNSPPALHAAAAASVPGDDRPFETAAARAADFSVEAGQRALRGVRGKISGKFEGLAMRAVGGLCKHLERVSGSRYSPVGISRFAVDGYLAVDPETIAALQIFPSVRVKSIVHGAGRSVGEASIFSMIGNFISSVPGRRKLSQWLALPLRSISALNARLNGVEAFFSGSSLTIRNFQHNLSSMKDLVKQLKRVATKHDFEGKSKVLAWKSLLQSLKAVVDFSGNLAGSQLPAALQLTEGMTILRQLVIWISEAIDFTLSTRDAQVRVHAGLVPGIDDLRGKQREIELLLSRLVSGEVKVVSEKLKSKTARILQTEVMNTPGNSSDSETDDPLQLKLQYYPRLGYLVSVSLEISSQYPEMAETLNWSFQFKSEDAAFFKSSLCKNMDDEFGDIVGEIRKAEYQFLYDLCSRMITDETLEKLHAVTEAVAELDVLIALALAAKSFGWTRPNLAESGNTNLVNARHPLIELCPTLGKSVIPNSFEIHSRNFHVITGPNSSGKSTFLKQVGSIIYLAQIGSFVPAQNATISIFDFLSCRFSSEADEDVSAFCADMQFTAKTLQNAEDRSLIIFDEFGRGTCHPDAVALTAGFASYCANLPVAPTVLISTHFGAEISSILQSCSNIKTFTTSLIPPVDAKSEPTFLYQLKPGICESAFALNCARKANLPVEVVRRSEEILGALRAGADPPAKRTEDERITDLEIVTCFKSWNKKCAKDLMKKIGSICKEAKFALLPL